MVKNTKHFKEMLLKELSVLESELATIGRKNPDNPADWETIRKVDGIDTAEEGEVAEGIEEYENNNAVLAQLEIRLNDVKNALAKIEKGTYGICEKCKKKIDYARLEVKPQANYCMKCEKELEPKE